MTVSECMGMGPLPMAEALRVAMNLAEELRKLHDEGKIHGSLTPDLIELGTNGLEIRPAIAEAAAAITPYTAPEVLEGQAPDVRADIFAFGAIVFEMSTGRRAFDGKWSTPPTSRSPGLDRILAPCMAKDPEKRISRIQRVMLELKLLAVAARRTEAGTTLRRERSENTMRSEMKEMELRMEARFAALAEAHENALAELQHAAHDTAETLKEQISVLCSELAAAQERVASVTATPIETHLEKWRERILGQIEGCVEELRASMESVKDGAEELSRKSQQFEQKTSAELRELSRTAKSNAAAIAASRMSEAQSEDLMERVIELLETVQADVLDTECLPVQEPAPAS